MKKFEHILLTSDVDATFFWEESYVAPSNLEAVRYFVANGGRFSFASGRNHRDVFLILPHLEDYVNLPCVLCNGGFLFDLHTKEILNPQYLQPQAAVELIRRVRERFDGLRFRASTVDGFLVPTGEADVFSAIQQNLLDAAVFCDLDKMDGERWFKVVFPGEHETLEEVREFLLSTDTGDFSYYYSGPRILEVLPKGITKATQLTWLREQYRCTDPDVQLWCIGDYDNDEDMLRCADVAACPSNATDAVKRLCDIEVCHCKDGAIAALVEEMERSIG